ncbi:MAG: hypothetical protein CVU73_12805 [Deltaproteobacteria bacterium HGW-Deltaproteobacteria-8]|jgi:tetratricopeptide (TPR) repeat protein|nr:MAG: hypothetical protein CVU73_12805 [Deltaproteobacteria bacterium HGW-Deltaproteobacteria-8]
MKKVAAIIAMLTIAVLVSGCASTYNEAGKKIAYLPGKVGLGSTKLEVFNTYGHPSAQRQLGELYIYDYNYTIGQAKHDRLIAQGTAALFTMGISNLFVDHGVNQSDFKEDYQELQFIFDNNSKVVDFHYHDSQGNGNDESETIYLKAVAAVISGNMQEGIILARRSVESNQNNHRSLNFLAWYLVDMGINPKEGVSLAERAVKLWSYEPNYWDTLGTAQAKVGDFVGAKESLEQAMKLYPVYMPGYNYAHTKTIYEQVSQQLTAKKKM